MLSKKITIINKLGLHARAAAKLVNLANRYSCETTLSLKGETITAKSIMEVMMLAASQGTELILCTDGDDEETAMSELEALIQDRFGEGE